ncbi:hypothetical protein HIV01_016355 [Lysobacter arenosi]|uniref:Uncharacterized protein n=1 Tax=Lysobacter arenosi TaxID=2795387 RepID=A0ABX7RBG9_9GAMM|nr:hypothetical protein [Lysobacter arenosi]QSX74719.1 hypothetical protein HIV01_016355 [Lysobacter arenosi]
MTRPLSFRKAFWLFLRNSSPNAPFQPDFARQTGISEVAATACILLGFFAGVPLTLGFARLLIPWLVDFFVPLFVLTVIAFFILVQGAATYAAYRAWHRRCYPAA